MFVVIFADLGVLKCVGCLSIYYVVIDAIDQLYLILILFLLKLLFIDILLTHIDLLQMQSSSNGFPKQCTKH